MYENCVTLAATMHRNSGARMSQLIRRFSEIEDVNKV